MAVSLLTGLSLVSSFVAYFRFHSEFAQELCFLALTAPVLVMGAQGLADFHKAFRSFAFALPYLAAMWISLALNSSDADVAVRNVIILGNLTYAFTLCALLGNARAEEMVSAIMRSVFLCSAPVFLYVLAVVPRDVGAWGRWIPFDVQPNWWGMMALGLAWTAFSCRNTFLKIAGAVLASYFMYRVQSRGAMLALIPAVLFCSGWFFPLSPRRITALVVTVCALILGILAYSTLFPDSTTTSITEFFMNDVARLNDKYRGLGSGMTGRTQAYEVGLEAFMDSPLLGSGMGTFRFIHNGFLQVLAEGGLFALVGMLLLFSRALYGYLTHRNWAGVGYVLSYTLALMTYPRTLNINMTSLLFIIIVMQGRYTQPVHRIPRPRHRQHRIHLSSVRQRGQARSERGLPTDANG